MLKPGDFVVPLRKGGRGQVRAYFADYFESIGVVLSVGDRYEECHVLPLYTNPYATGMNPGWTNATTSYYKIDGGICRRALNAFLACPTEENGLAVLKLANRYDRSYLYVPNTALQRVRSFDEAIAINRPAFEAHYKRTRHQTSGKRFKTFDNFMNDRREHLQEIMMQGTFETVSRPLLHL